MRSTSTCPTENVLLAFLGGRLPAAELAGVQDHIYSCSLCLQLLPALGSSSAGPVEIPAASLPQPVPERIDEYRLLGLLGHGAMGQVYLAKDMRLERTVAIKFLLSTDPLAQERLVIEARAIARLSHPNVVTVFRVGEVAGRPYLVSEFVQGKSLDQLKLPLPWEQGLRIGTDLARGLAAAHRRGVLHRDIKPANAMLAEDGTAKLLDFGLAKLQASMVPVRATGGSQDAAPTPQGIRSDAIAGSQPELQTGIWSEAPDAALPLTATGVLLGTPRYMPRELWQGASATAASDVYSLGALLFELCAGQPPYSGGTLRELRRALEEAAPELRSLIPTVSPDLSAVVARCLDRDPASRYPSGEALFLALEELRPVRRRLSEAAAEWERLGRPQDVLWSQRQLGEVAELLREESLRRGDLSPLESAFLLSSRGAVRRRRRWIGSAAVLVLSLPLLLWGAARLQARREIAKQVTDRITAAEQTLGQAREADRRHKVLAQAATEAFDSHQRTAGEAQWQAALRLVGPAARRYAEGRQLLEAALQLDGTNAVARSLFRRVLWDSALLAERTDRLDARDDLFAQLLVLDPSARAELERDAELRLTVDPPGSSLTLGRYRAVGRRLHLESISSKGASPPPPSLALAPGSYLLELSAPGRVGVRYPILLARGEQLAVRIVLPETATVPEGFVYVPAGRFLFGDSDEEARNSFLDTPPLHQATTGAYIIAQHETTMAEYLRFLRALDKKERARYLPNSGGVGNREGMAVQELPGGTFHYTLRKGSLLLSADEGQRVRYPSRTKRAEQDWLRFPVGGIPWAAAVAYAAWLDRTGQVPGARPCTDHEWERAARGADGRLYPIGDLIEPDDANFDRTYDQLPDTFGPDEVGSHPASRSPFDVDDLVANAAEWVQSSFLPDERVARGGSYYLDFRTARSTTRFTPEESYHDAVIGIRVCAGRR